MNNNKIKMIAFDLDGTLYFNKDFILKAYQDTILEINNKYNRNINCPSLEDIMMQTGNPITKIFKNLFINESEEFLIKISTLLLKKVVYHVINKNGKIAVGAEYILKILHKAGYKIALVSNGRSGFIVPVLKTYNLLQYFEPLYFIDGFKYKFKADLLNNLLDKYNITSDELILVGDRKSDMVSAKIVGCKTIGCKYGYGKENELDDADYKINSLFEIIPIINKENKNIIKRI